MNKSKKQFVINVGNGPNKKAKIMQQQPSNGVLIIPINDEQRASIPPSQSANVKVITTLDIKSTRLQILAAWQSYKPLQIIAIFRKHYTNLNSLSVMLSRFKKQLEKLENGPPLEFLDEIKLSKKEYNEIRKISHSIRAKGSLNVLVLSNADDIVLQALQYMTSSDPNLLLCGLLITTGMRPIEIFKVGKFTSKLNNQQGDKTPWFACQTRFAKRGNMKTMYNQCRDRCFLCPFWIVERALNLVRRRWTVKHLSNVEINRKYASTWGKILQKGYPQWPGINARYCRRFFAVYSYEFFGKSFFMEGSTQASLIGFSHWMLGHAVLGDEAIAYQSIQLRPVPKLKLFELGRNLKVKQ
jgi:hypothetical protein